MITVNVWGKIKRITFSKSMHGYWILLDGEMIGFCSRRNSSEWAVSTGKGVREYITSRRGCVEHALMDNGYRDSNMHDSCPYLLEYSLMKLDIRGKLDKEEHVNGND